MSNKEKNNGEQPEVENTQNEETTEAQTEATETVVEETPELTPEQKIEELEATITEQKDKYLRLFAEFDNYKKRTAKERLELIQTAGKDVMLSIIPTLDDLNRAIQNAEEATDVTAVKEGFVLVKNKLFSSLTQKGLKPMQAKGEDFNPDRFEALTKIPAPSEDMKGKVIDEIETGYTLNDKIIRYAKVVIGE